MVEHNEDREKELQLLCKGILLMTAKANESDHTPLYYYCPLCNSRGNSYKLLKNNLSLESIEHYLYCPWLIAKGLYTGDR